LALENLLSSKAQILLLASVAGQIEYKESFKEKEFPSAKL
jgi:hypothetical protein